jgi:outer membrane protein assembly factor BamA
MARSLAGPPRFTPPHHPGGAARPAYRAGLLLFLLLLLPGAARADWPPVRAIVFEGNDATQEKTMLREIPLHVGDPADPAVLEKSRQAILDLRLFRWVRVEQTPLDDGVQVKFLVHEKWYLLPYPRASANVYGQNSIGGEVRWDNLFGLNHTVRAIYANSDSRELGRGRSDRYFLGYDAPFLFDSPYRVGIALEHLQSPVTDPVAYDETFDTAQVLVGRKLDVDDGRAPSRGWIATGGVAWRREDTRGVGAPAPYGRAIGLIGDLHFNDLHYSVYSDSGTAYGGRVEIANTHLGSDYGYERLDADYAYILPLAQAHEDVEFGANLGRVRGGAPGVAYYALGGANGLHGYRRQFDQGNFFYLFSADYLHPLVWDWLRLAVMLEAGDAFAHLGDFDGSLHWSLGLGLRARFTRLVNFEFEAGLAIPLDRVPQLRFYGDRLNR